MRLRTQLVSYLSKLDQMQLVKGRQALIRFVAFDHLRNKINWEGTALTFVDGLLLVLAEEGREDLIRFLTLLEQSNFLGLDQIGELNRFRNSISSLSSKQWDSEFVNAKYPTFGIAVSDVIVKVLIGFLNNVSYGAHQDFISNNFKKVEFQTLIQKTQLALVDKLIDNKSELIEEISRFLKLPEVEEVIRQFYANKLLRSSEQEHLDVIHKELSLLLSLHTTLKGEKLKDTSLILFETILAGCDQALLIANKQGMISTSEETSSFYKSMLIDYSVAITKNVDFLGTNRKLDIQTVLDFEGKYRQQVVERHNCIRPPFIEAAKDVPMNKLYVPCEIVAETQSQDKQQHQKINMNILRTVIYRTVLLGNPGGGKSTFASKLCYDIATNYMKNLLPGRQVTPILVVLRKYGEKKKTHHYSILKFIEVTAEADYQIPTPPSGAFEYLLRNGRALVIFDGLDELLDTSDRQEISKDVELFCSMYPTVPILVTSREVGYDQAPLNEEHFRIYHLTSFNEAQIHEYVTKWFALVQNLTEEERQQRINSFMKESQQVPDLRSNPLMLALMCNIYRGEGYIPENRPDLYEKCADMLFKQWDKGRGITVQVALSPRTRYAMMFLAHWIYLHTALQEGVTESQLIIATTEHLCPRPYEDRDEAEQAAREIIEFCRGRAWVFTDTGTTKTGEKLYQFTHRTFLEFFSAAHLIRTHSVPTELVNILLPKIAAKEWDVVAQLAFHMLARQTAGAEDTLPLMLLDHLEERSENEVLNILSFNARCLAFLLPSQVVVRKVTIACAERWLVEQVRYSTRADTKEINPIPMGNTKEKAFIPAVLIGDLLFAALENRTTIQKALEQWLVAKINESDEYRASLAAQLSIYLQLAMHASTPTYRPEMFSFWNKVSKTISLSCSERLVAFSKKNLFIAQKLLFEDLLSITEIVKHHGLKNIFISTYSQVFNFINFGSIADDVLYRIFSLNENPKKSDISKNIFEKLVPIMLKTSPPWVEDAVGMPRFYRVKDKKIADQFDKELFNSTVVFGIFCLLATSIESSIERYPHGEERDRFFREYFDAYNTAVTHLLNVVITARHRPVESQRIQHVMNECGFTPPQQRFAWRWIHQEVDLVRTTIKQMPLYGIPTDGDDDNELLN